MTNWYDLYRGKINLSTLFLHLLKLEERSSEIIEKGRKREIEKLLRKIPRKAVKLAAELLRESVETFYKYQLKGLLKNFYRIKLDWKTVKEAQARISQLEHTLSSYANPGLSLTKEDYPLLYSFNFLKSNLTKGTEKEKAIYESFLLLCPNPCSKKLNLFIIFLSSKNNL